MSLLRLLPPYLRRQRGWLVGLVLLQAVQTGCSLLLPAVNADVVDRGILREDLGVVTTLGAVMGGVSVVELLAAVGAVVCAARVGLGVAHDLRTDVFGRVLRYSAQELNAFGAGSLTTRTTNDVQQVQLLVVSACSMLLLAPLTVVGGVLMAVRQDPGLAWLMAIGAPVMGGALGLVMWRAVPWFTRLQLRLDTVNGVVRDQLVGVRVVRAFVREDHERARFAAVNDDLARTALRAARLMGLAFPVILLLMNASSVAVLWFGAGRIRTGDLTVGALIAFLSYFTLMLMAVTMASFVLLMAPRAAVCAARIREVLNTDTSLVRPTAPVRGLASRPMLEFRAAGFRYPRAEEPVLQSVSFRCEPGQTTAVVGSTGAGKTTLVGLAARLLDPTSGAVLLGGVDVRELSPDVLWQRIGLVPQRAYLFSGTVASNLRHGKPDATDEELWAALEVAQARDLVAALPGGLEARIAQGGSNLSGGQRQRLSIARAVVRRPAVFLFDDAFSALDVATEERLRVALVPHLRDAVVLTVAQRVSTILTADQIVALDAGRVVGLGTHEQLVATCPTYQEIVESQQSTAVPA